jgi:hypothetical protein
MPSLERMRLRLSVLRLTGGGASKARSSSIMPVSSDAKASHRSRLGSPYRFGPSNDWIKVKNPAAPAVKREAEED